MRTPLILCLLLMMMMIVVCESAAIETVASFTRLLFNFPTPELEQEYITKEHYKNCAIAGIKLDSMNNIYVSIPRFKDNVPVTLAKLNTTTNRLDPYPSYEWNSRLDNVTHSLQSVLGFEIDSMDRMWILDQGKISGRTAQKGSIKLIIWDLRKNELVYQYHFSEEEAPLETSFLNDIVVNTADSIAFISDSGLSSNQSLASTPAIIYFDMSDQIVKRMLVDAPSTRYNESVTFSVNGKECFGPGNPMRTGADGIALSCDGLRLYWTPLTSRNLYAIDTDVLQMYEAGDKIVLNSVIDLGNKIGVSDGLGSTSRRDLIVTDLENDAIYTVSDKVLEPYVKQSEYEKRKQVIQDGKLAALLEQVANNSLIHSGTRMIWPDTVAISNDYYMYFVSNNLCSFLNGELDFDKPNFFIYRVYLPDKSRSYVYGCEYEKVQLRFIEWFLIISGAVVFGVSLTVLLVYTVRKTRREEYAKLQEE